MFTQCKRNVISIVAATAWIGFSEFLRNELVFEYFWVEQYRSLGLVFPSEPLNGVVWGVWSLLFAVGIFLLARRESLVQTVFLAWFFAFVLMWVVIGNLGVLPLGLLVYAVPLSLLETFIATWIIKKLS